MMVKNSLGSFWVGYPSITLGIQNCSSFLTVVLTDPKGTFADEFSARRCGHGWSWPKGRCLVIDRTPPLETFILEIERLDTCL